MSQTWSLKTAVRCKKNSTKPQHLSILTLADNAFAKRIYRLKLNNASFTAIVCNRRWISMKWPISMVRFFILFFFHFQLNFILAWSAWQKEAIGVLSSAQKWLVWKKTLYLNKWSVAVLTGKGVSTATVTWSRFIYVFLCLEVWVRVKKNRQVVPFDAATCSWHNSLTFGYCMGSMGALEAR